MIIELNKFGTTLTSRQAGKEAIGAFQYMLKNISENEDIIIDFSGVSTFSPSWGDEFLSFILNNCKQKLILKASNNPSVISTIKTLQELNKIKFNILQ